jgi:DNA-binding FadR family transcriptional regulator
MATRNPRAGTLNSIPTRWPDFRLLEGRGSLGLDRATLDQLTEVRLAVEPAAAGIAARQRTEHDLKVLRATLKRMYTAQGNQLRFSEADYRFHAALSVATHNPFFRSLISATEFVLSKFLRKMSVEVVADGKLHARSAALHAKILDAVEARDSKAAERAMILVIEDGLKDATETLLHAGARPTSKPRPSKSAIPRRTGRRPNN